MLGDALLDRRTLSITFQHGRNIHNAWYSYIEAILSLRLMLDLLWSNGEVNYFYQNSSKSALM